MATTKPRLSITMDPDVYDAVKEFASVTNGTVSGLISDCLRAALPQLNLISATVRTFKEGHAELDAEAAVQLEKRLKGIENLADQTREQMDIFVHGLAGSKKR